jgi:hypothetical protein
MDATTFVAVVGAIGTPVVALAGYLFNDRRASRDREATMELTRASHEHEMDVRRRERAYEARKEAYRIVLQWAIVNMQQVQLTDPILTYAGMPDPPENVPQELFDTMNVEVAAFGSQEVKQAIDEFRDAVDAFFVRNGIARRIQDQDVPGEQGVQAYLERDAARQTARDRFDELAAEINDDLTTL